MRPKVTLLSMALLAASVCLSGCSSDKARGAPDAASGSGSSSGTDASPGLQSRLALLVPEDAVAACSPFEVAIEPVAGAAFAPGARVTVRLDGADHVPAQSAELDGQPVRFEAPPVALPTTVEVVATVEEGGAEIGQLRAELTLDTPERDALGFSVDCGAFPWGVASGDPGPDAVLIWTRATPPAEGGDVELTWQLAVDAAFSDGVFEGQVTAAEDDDYTVLVDVTGLQERARYYYRFLTADGETSVVGRTRAAGSGDEPVRLAAASCSSVFSGYFNAYARLAEEPDLDLVVHLGDYVYDTIDSEERVRVPDPEPAVPQTPEDWRARYRLYLSDADFRAARAMHPWTVIWDNHEADEKPSEAGQEGVRVFQEYVPMRLGDPARPRDAWRHLSYGSLLDIYMLDITVPRLDDEQRVGSLFGDAQWAWLEQKLQESNARWRVLGQQKLVAELSAGGTGLVGEASPWNAYSSTREAFFELLRPVGDNVVLSGDFHTTVGADLVLDPTDPTYDPGGDAERSVGVEVLGASVTRGNFDETICGGPCETAFEENLVTELGNTLRGLNPHFATLELRSHGYAVLTISEDDVSATWRYTPILEPSRELTDGATLIVEHGANRWRRD